MGLRVCVLGKGAWGSTLAWLLLEQGHHVRTWSRRDGGDPQQLLEDQDLIVSALALVGVRELSVHLAQDWRAGLPLLSCSKGIDLVHLCTASQLWERQIPQLPVVVLSGPNLAAELRQGLPAASVLACHDHALATHLQQQLSGGCLRLYTNADPLGTELAGALKNVMAMAAGICDGLGLGANAKASLLCRGLAEMGLVLSALGGQAGTLYGLAGLGDLLATANSPLSRNYRYGSLLAQGHSHQEALNLIAATVEGAPTAEAVMRLAQTNCWHLPICEQVLALIQGRISPQQTIQALMERTLRGE